MHNVLGTTIKKGKNIFDKLDSKYNFSFKKNLISYHGINGRTNDSTLTLDENNFRLQIGKMNKEGETIYTKDVLLAAIEYIIQKAKGRVKIQLWPDLARNLTNKTQESSKENILSFEKEKQQIIRLIKKHARNAYGKIEIINVAEVYPDIFSKLKTDGSSGLKTKEKPDILNNELSALNIVQYLYRACQQNPKLMKVFYDTKPKEQKESDKEIIGKNESDYYSVVEVGIRLYEIISGISVQGGIDRQKVYDQIIGLILQGKDIDIKFKIEDYPELKDLHTACLKKNPNFSFYRIRIDTKDTKELSEKKTGKIQIKMITGAIAIALLSALGGGKAGIDLYKKSEEKKIKEKIILHEEKFWKDKSIIQMERDREIQSDILNKFVPKFIERYGQGGLSKEEIYDALYSFVRKDKIGMDALNKYLQNREDTASGLYINNLLDVFAENYFYKEMYKNGFNDIEPQYVFKDLEEDFIATLKYTGPVREGYNPMTEKYTLIHQTKTITKNDLSENSPHIVIGYLFEHDGRIMTYRVQDNEIERINMAQTERIDHVTMSRSTPDKNNIKTIKTFVFDENTNDESGFIKKLRKFGKKIIFINNISKSNLGNQINLEVNKEEIINVFANESRIFQKYRLPFLDMIDKKEGEISSTKKLELKKMMIIELHESNKLQKSSEVELYEMDVSFDIYDFLESFIKRHEALLQ